MVLFYALVGLWGVVQGIRRKPLDGSYRGALILAEGLGIIQLLVGVLLLFVVSARPRDDLHYLYGLSVVVTLPIVNQYLADRRLPAPLAYGLGCLFMAGLAIRGITTGR